jgi:phosphotransacetylase
LLFPEGDDPRVREAARWVTALGFAHVTLIAERPVAGADTLHPRDLKGLADVELDDAGGRASAAARLVASGFAAGAVLGVGLPSGVVLRAALRDLGLAADRQHVAGCAWVHSEIAGRRCSSSTPS